MELLGDTETLQTRAHKKLDGSTGFLDLDFMFMFIAIDYNSGDKDDDSDSTHSRVMVRHSLPAGWPLHNKCSLNSIKLTGRGELVLMGFVLEVLEGEFRWTKGSSGIFKARSISLEDQAFSFLPNQIQNEHSIEYLLSSFIVLMMVRFLRPKLLKEHKTDLEQYPPAPTSTGNRCTLHCFQ